MIDYAGGFNGYNSVTVQDKNSYAKGNILLFLINKRDERVRNSLRNQRWTLIKLIGTVIYKGKAIFKTSLVKNVSEWPLNFYI